MKTFNMNNKRGFTLVEVLVVVVLIATLVSIGTPFYKDYVEKQKAVSGLNNSRILIDSIERYRAIHNQNLPVDGKFTMLDVNIPSNMLNNTGTQYDDGYFKYTLDNDNVRIVAERKGGLYYLRYYLNTDELKCHDNASGDICKKFNIDYEN